MKQRIPYGIMNYAELVRKNGYFIDKTKYIMELERGLESCILTAKEIWKIPVLLDAPILL